MRRQFLNYVNKEVCMQNITYKDLKDQIEELQAMERAYLRITEEREAEAPVETPGEYLRVTAVIDAAVDELMTNREFKEVFSDRSYYK